ncbi:DUF1959 domain-containing protein [Methanococcus voltae]|uniref:Energy-converting hydrogenase A subunit M n=2 Tax=Methanococcus voltae TaxID=2188 RepID=A0A8J7UUV3_METVO|nr:DUF1959 domain-containing protein [Methanococcus voltae]MBP2172869.1 energy-converting hydrogenase A subunit M [Methanococcus voltae]MBP2201721.1 energy-converting hydrogenase A subunit M [Methanococcus voltae]MCS3922509.1 energy-converting hydrogenase A subunit M [Methanococcus voltae PS]
MAEEDNYVDKNYDKDSLAQKYNIIKDNRYIMEDAIMPIARALKLPIDEVVGIFASHYDGISLYEIHAYIEQAKMGCLGRKVDIDLGLCWLSDFLGIISKSDADLIRKKVVEDTLINKIDYEKALDKGRKLTIALMKE